jgi:transcriptional regulator with XRE-family HTH domain
MESIAADVLRLRNARNLSQEDAAKLVGVTQHIWSDWERGKVVPSPLARRALALVFRSELESMRPPPTWYVRTKAESPTLRNM